MKLAPFLAAAAVAFAAPKPTAPDVSSAAAPDPAVEDASPQIEQKPDAEFRDIVLPLPLPLPLFRKVARMPLAECYKTKYFITMPKFLECLRGLRTRPRRPVPDPLLPILDGDYGAEGYELGDDEFEDDVVEGGHSE
ncbi:hypothetical protein Cob_v009239 [Colletotrichum orbiculare MAFF 240422]|uniref:Uncharacterized protein n=1 Tax=Colletotrichum orbiculare (strain 104-T / ATCC 96160 / CBS 514.97 / LARS 414 / MAFF 240422) TaxID=1213857 RepID=N4V2Y1_COLOR|nr:hypothetical protein Cob_v009239 [Colletotrichum orbiculare MAFF 240422]